MRIPVRESGHENELWLSYWVGRIIRGQVIRYSQRKSARENRKRLKNRDFTIISNNCWGGLISEKYGLRKNSPTCGLLIHGKDYVKFCENLKHYISQKLVFIPMEQAKFYSLYAEFRFPVAKLDDIEIYFMHYPSEKVAAEKWYRRCNRINWDNIIYKLSERETFSPDIMRKFAQLKIDHKLIFGSEKYSNDTVVIKDIDRLKGDEFELIETLFDEAEYLNKLKTDC